MATVRFAGRAAIIGLMALADVLSRRRGRAARIPERLDELRGPAQGVVVLPVHLTWYGLREFDVSDAPSRVRMYTIVLSQGERNDIARFLHPVLLAPSHSRPLTARASSGLTGLSPCCKLPSSRNPAEIFP